MFDTSPLAIQWMIVLHRYDYTIADVFLFELAQISCCEVVTQPYLIALFGLMHHMHMGIHGLFDATTSKGSHFYHFL